MCRIPAKIAPKSTDKHLSYETVAALKQSFGHLLHSLTRLRELGVLRAKLCTALQAALEETRAWSNFEVTERLHDREQSDWVRG